MAFILISLPHLFVAQAATQDNATAKIEINKYNGITTPHSPLELVENIRKIGDSGLLLEKSFYNKEIVNTVFGGSNVEMRGGRYYFLGFDSVIPYRWRIIPGAINGVYADVAALKGDWDNLESVQLAFNLKSSDSSLNMKSVHDLMGPNCLWYNEKYKLPNTAPANEVGTMTCHREKRKYTEDFFLDFHSDNNTLGFIRVIVTRNPNH